MDTVSEGTVTEEGSTSDSNQSSGSTPQCLVPESPPTGLSKELEQLLQDLAEVRDLPIYTLIFNQYSKRTGAKLDYKYDHN